MSTQVDYHQIWFDIEPSSLLLGLLYIELASTKYLICIYSYAMMEQYLYNETETRNDNMMVYPLADKIPNFFIRGWSKTNWALALIKIPWQIFHPSLYHV